MINDCRKNGLLPLDITALDVAREFSNLEEINDNSPEIYAESLLCGAYACADDYYAESFWADQDHYAQMLVEKIDLRELFQPVCEEFRVPSANARGWSDLHTRADMMRRFQEWEAEGNQPVLLYCGDFDPDGVQISDFLINNMRELQAAVGWDPSNVIVDRFGLNQDFIEANDLSWTPNLITGSGRDLAKPKGGKPPAGYVKKWLDEVGERKAEANALVTRPAAGRDLCREAITRYVDADAPEV